MARAVKNSAGFTLIELGVVIGLIAITTAIAIPSINALSGAKLRSTTAMVAGLTREAYARAAITGKVHRIVFDIDKGLFWLERTEESYVLPSEKLKADLQGRGGETPDERQEAATQGVKMRVDALANGAGAPAEALALLGMGSDANGLDAMFGSMLGQNAMGSSLTSGIGVDQDMEEALKSRLRRRVSFLPVDDDLGKAQKLSGDVRFFKVWIEHQKDAFTGGSAELYFFATGYTERALIMLTDDEDGRRVLTVDVNPLTARARIKDEEPEIPRG
jgi:type II secretory pathway pseudopilin PulG